jgi:phosphatidylglycerol:prolipoprotein diacylglycerol transferase
MALHPTQIYEAVVNGAIFILLGYLWKRGRQLKYRPGRIAMAYVFIYAAARFVLEFYRGDDRGGVFGGLFPSQWIALGAAAGAAAMWVWGRHRSCQRV